MVLVDRVSLVTAYSHEEHSCFALAPNEYLRRAIFGSTRPAAAAQQAARRVNSQGEPCVDRRARDSWLEDERRCQGGSYSDRVGVSVFSDQERVDCASLLAPPRFLSRARRALPCGGSPAGAIRNQTS